MSIVVVTPQRANAETIEYRINAGGPENSSVAPVWEEDSIGSPSQYNNVDETGQNTVTPAPAGTVLTKDASVPAGTPDPVLLIGRHDPTGGGAELEWDFPVTNGVYEVRLYFTEVDKEANGLRTFDVTLDGTIVLDDYDIHADVGHDVAVMKSFNTAVSDGTIDIDFGHVVDNPIIMAIEIFSLSTVSPVSLDLTAAVNGTNSGTVTVVNNGDENLTVESTGISGTDAAQFSDDYSDTDTVLATGESVDIEVTFNAPAADGESTASLDVTVDLPGPAGPYLVSTALTGTAIDVDVSPDPVALTTNVETSTSTAVTVTNNGTASVTVGSSEISGTDAAQFSDDYSDTDTVLATGESVDIEVTFNAPAATGESTASLDISIDGVVVATTLSGTATSGDISADPAALDFGDVLVDGTSTIEVTVTNEGDGSTEVTGATLTGDAAGAFTVNTTGLPTDLAPSGSLTLDVSFSPTTTGSQSATLTVSSDSGDLVVSLSGTGALPGDVFTDIDDSIFQTEINWLAATGITKGCNPPTNDEFCPNDLVTRGQMAAFLHRALDGILTPGDAVEFIDDDGSTFEADIEWLGATGVTKGCNPPTNDEFCPNDHVTREQMAAFLFRALGS